MDLYWWLKNFVCGHYSVKSCRILGETQQLGIMNLVRYKVKFAVCSEENIRLFADKLEDLKEIMCQIFVSPGKAYLEGISFSTFHSNVEYICEFYCVGFLNATT